MDSSSLTIGCTLSELLRDKSKWTQKVPARTVLGKFVIVHSPDATCWCLLGAIEKCIYENYYCKVKDIFYSELPTGCSSIVKYNDEIATFEDIQRITKEVDSKIPRGWYRCSNF